MSMQLIMHLLCEDSINVVFFIRWLYTVTLLIDISSVFLYLIDIYYPFIWLEG